MCPENRRLRCQSGFGVIAAIVVLVVLASLAGFIVSQTTTQSLTLAQDIQGARAYQAARNGVEWAVARWLETAPSDTARCPGTEASMSTVGTITGLDGFDVEVQTALTTTSGGLQFCRIQATARPTGTTSANAGALSYIERQVRIVAGGNP
jgi:MSHA biogenesis protein MshP